jgi:hypothetical protein
MVLTECPDWVDHYNDDKGKRVFFQSFPKEPLIKSVIVMPAKAGIQERSLKPLDSGFRRNDKIGEGVLVQSFPNVVAIRRAKGGEADRSAPG